MIPLYYDLAAWSLLIVCIFATIIFVAITVWVWLGTHGISTEYALMAVCVALLSIMCAYFLFEGIVYQSEIKVCNIVPDSDHGYLILDASDNVYSTPSDLAIKLEVGYTYNLTIIKYPFTQDRIAEIAPRGEYIGCNRSVGIA